MTTPPTPRRLIALAACMAALVAGGCGADDEEPKGAPIPAAQAQDLQQRLDEIQRRFDFGDGACNDIQLDSKDAVESILSSIPNNVAADVRSALDDSFNSLFRLSADQCDEEKGQTTETTPAPPPETETTETTTTETETTPTTPPETETVPTTPEPPATTPEPPGTGNGNGNGNGQGNGNGEDNGLGQGGGGGAEIPGDEQ